MTSTRRKLTAFAVPKRFPLARPAPLVRLGEAFVEDDGTITIALELLPLNGLLHLRDTASTCVPVAQA